MRLRQIAHMDVVADTGAVGRWVVRAEHRDLAALSVCDLQDQRNEVGFGEMRFAERTVRSAAYRRPVAAAVQHIMRSMTRLVSP